MRPAHLPALSALGLWIYKAYNFLATDNYRGKCTTYAVYMALFPSYYFRRGILRILRWFNDSRSWWGWWIYNWKNNQLSRSSFAFSSAWSNRILVRLVHISWHWIPKLIRNRGDQREYAQAGNVQDSEYASLITLFMRMSIEECLSKERRTARWKLIPSASR